MLVEDGGLGSAQSFEPHQDINLPDITFSVNESLQWPRTYVYIHKGGDIHQLY